MGFSIKINGNYLPNGVKIKSGSVNLNQGQSGERTVLSFSLIDMNLTGIPFIWNTLCGHKIELYEDGILKFGGQLDEPETRKINNHPIYGEKITCVDWHIISDRIYINQSYSKDLISNVFKNMIDEFLSTDGIWYDSSSIQETSSQYVSINCPYIIASQAFNEMAGLINWQWRIGPDKKFYLNEYTTVLSDTLIENESNYLPNSLLLVDDKSEYRNKQILKDVNALTDFLPEKATPTPDQDNSYFVRFPLNQKPDIYITDIENVDNPPAIDMVDTRNVGIGGIDSGLLFYWNKGSNIIQKDSESDPIPDNKVIVVEYVGQYKIDIIEEDSVAIAERQSVEGGSGIYTYVDSGSEIEGIAIAENKASAILERYSRIATKISFSSFTIDLNVGESIDLKLPSFNINTESTSEYFLVMEKKIQDVGHLLLKTYTLVDGAPVGSWINFFKKLIQPGKDWTIRENVKVDIPIDTDESWGWGGQITIKTFDVLYPVDDPGGLYPSNILFPGTLTSTVVEND